MSSVESAQRHAGGSCAAISRRVAARLHAQRAAMTCSSLRESCSIKTSLRTVSSGMDKMRFTNAIDNHKYILRLWKI